MRVSLYGDHAFVRVMSTEKYVCSVCVFLFMATMLLCGSCQLRSMCVVCVSLCGDHAFVRVMSTEKCVCVSLYGDHAFVRVMSTEKYVCSVCFSLRRPCFCAGHVD